MNSIDMLVELEARAALREIRDLAQRARLELGLPLVLYTPSTDAIELPRFFRCPECGGRLCVEIFEWESADGAPVRDGFYLWCNAELDDYVNESGEEQHRQCFSRQDEWFPIERRVLWWLRRRVRVTAS